MADAAVLLVLALGRLATICRWPLVYLLLSIVAVVASLGAVLNAVSAEPALWPSELWRYAGAALNGAGFLASGFAISAFFRWKFTR